MLQSYNPHTAETIWVWAVPRSLATTKGITLVFLSTGYLDVSVLRVCPPCGVSCLQHEGLPHSEIHGSKGYLLLPVAYRSLSRPSSPLRAKASAIRSYLLSLLFLQLNMQISFFQHVKELNLIMKGKPWIINSKFTFIRKQAVMKQPNVYCFLSYITQYLKNSQYIKLVENKGFEPLTPSLQS